MSANTALDQIKANYARACAEIDRLTEGSPATAWRWSIPANPERDSDLILSDSLESVPKLLAALEAVEDVLLTLDTIEACQPSGYKNWNLCAGGTADVLRKAITDALA